MPTYNMHCDGCNTDFEIDHSIHDFPLPTTHTYNSLAEPCDPCGPIVQVISAPVIHNIGGTAARRTFTSQREKDSEAYRRLRRDGVQPKGVTGAAEIEQRAGEKHEVERDVVFQDRKFAKRITKALADVPT